MLQRKSKCILEQTITILDENITDTKMKVYFYHYSKRYTVYYSDKDARTG